ncbi:cocaine- and amphetamine-regulated transcript protein-like isoform X1 [Gopherus flavomarginatus]|uniref:cocaine- and amphetamine-regulated transcript protein-like isoform X1 n=1 Tax=Gopherus flavomarginatus TaxID=286002 RepID=UPI0021CC23C9|nr:cocaine- and amphetamine-regulated transcript protein-like isoform X1 [Gopherus flavomarginatus]
MQRATMLLLCLALLAHQEADGDAQLPQDFPLKHSYQPQEKQLLEELQDVLEKLQSKRISTWEKKYNQVPKVASRADPAPSDSVAKGSMCVANAPVGLAQHPAALCFHFSAHPAEFAASPCSRRRPRAVPGRGDPAVLPGDRSVTSRTPAQGFA